MVAAASRSGQASAAIPAPHALTIAQAAAALKTHIERGLGEHEIEARRAVHGRNRLSEAPPTPLWRRLASQFASVLVGLLLAAALISAVLGEWPEAIAILAIVLLNALIGFLQEESAARALAGLRSLTAPRVRVVRAGQHTAVAADELVPGDLLHVEAGDLAPADARLVSSEQLSTQEAPLTGESTPVWKRSEPIATDTPLAERSNMLFAGTTVATGTGLALVVATGMQTELGQIAGMLEQTPQTATPLQKRLAVLGRYLVLACLALVAVIFALNLSRGHPPLEVFLFSVSLAVAAVPEGLPAVVTVALALGVRRMARRNALVRNLPAVETLGCVTTICSDKTGTLTRNEMTAREIWTPGGHYYVSGVGYDPQGGIHPVQQGGRPQAQSELAPPLNPAELPPEVARAIAVGALCNNAELQRQDDGAWQVLGDPTEGALRVLSAKAEWKRGAERLRELPFDSERRMMSVIVREHGETLMYSKGAVEAILARSNRVQRQDQEAALTPDIATSLQEAAAGMGARALRVLALAWRPVAEDPAAAEEAELIVVGLVGMIDPPRDEARDAIARCHQAGIRVLMITGDHPQTAQAIARDLRLSEAEQVVTGAELARGDEAGLAERVASSEVFARVSAEHKLQLVRGLQARGQVAAMTGDGVNDAPAVKAADIGIAMGRTGTDVTRGAADMVLLDDNFASIEAAVEEGRGIFDNIQKVTHYLLSCNAGELLLLLAAGLAGWPAPLVAVQILWINLITDGVPALALGVEPPERDIMRRPPRSPRAALIPRREALVIAGHGLLIAAAAGAGFAWALGDGGAAQEGQARAVAFSIMAFSQLFFAVACRSRQYTMPEIGWFTNRPLFAALAASIVLQLGVLSWEPARVFLRTEPLSGQHWAVVLALALVPATVVEGIKLLRAGLRQRRR